MNTNHSKNNNLDLITRYNKKELNHNRFVPIRQPLFFGSIRSDAFILTYYSIPGPSRQETRRRECPGPLYHRTFCPVRDSCRFHY